MSFNGYRANMPFVPTGTFTGETFTEKKRVPFPLDLNAKLIKHPIATYCMRVGNDELKDLNVREGDILLIDRAIKPNSHSLVVAYHDGEFVITRSNALPPDTSLWGVVTYVVKNVNK